MNIKKFDKSIIFFCVFVLVILTLLHICQIETYEEFTSTNNISNADLETAKDELIQSISDKLTIVNEKMNEFDEVKPIKPSAYRHLYETDLPEYVTKVRDANENIFDISQGVQNQRIKNLDNRTNQMMKYFDEQLDDNTQKPIKSIISHENGKNINLIQNGDFHNISINGGCLFVVNDETGEVDYDVTNFNRQDKNRLCLYDNPDQQFKLNKINDIDGYKEMIGSPVNETPNDDGEYPFYMITPKNFSSLCLKSENDSVSFQPCNYEKSLRWKGSEINK